MKTQVLGHTRFQHSEGGWYLHAQSTPGFVVSGEGIRVSAAPDQTLALNGRGVHTRNGDSIELRFRRLSSCGGTLTFGFDADLHEHAKAELDFASGTVSLATSDATVPQPVASAPLPVKNGEEYSLLIEKREGSGDLVKNSDVDVYFEGERLMSIPDLNLLPEMGVYVGVSGASLLIREFLHRGTPTGTPEYLHIGGWQMPNVESVEANLDSICRGLVQASEEGVQLLVTPETSLTGLFPRSPVTTDPGPIAEAERRLRTFIGGLPGAPFVIVGLPVWERVDGHGITSTRYNVCRVYDPDGEIASTHAKVHSAEDGFQHGYRLNELDVHGVPTALHICHDGRYPELWTLPVMFGARLVLHPKNGIEVTGSVHAFEEKAREDSVTSHAFYLNVNAGGGSRIVAPRNGEDSLLAVSPECRRDNAAYPMVGQIQEGLVHARIRVSDAFGYWPMRSFRASEQAARAYLSLYRTLGGGRGVGAPRLSAASAARA
jgi:predicted amidohydrolase